MTTQVERRINAVEVCLAGTLRRLDKLRTVRFEKDRKKYAASKLSIPVMFLEAAQTKLCKVQQDWTSGKLEVTTDDAVRIKQLTDEMQTAIDVLETIMTNNSWMKTPAFKTMIKNCQLRNIVVGAVFVGVIVSAVVSLLLL